MAFLDKDQLVRLYSSGLSMMDISKRNKVSIHKVAYWMSKYSINRRSWSEATYIKKNPNGDPFKFSSPSTLEAIKLFGIGLGLY